MLKRSALLIMLIALVGMGVAVGNLAAPLLDPALNTSEGEAAGTPYTVYERGRGARATVLIAHGFAGSRQLMLPFALTLANHGYRTVIFDFPGHGRNPQPAQQTADRTTQLLSAMEAVRQQTMIPEGPLFLVGHSMGSGAVVRYAPAFPAQATVAISLVSTGVTATEPANLLVVTGALEANLRPNAVQAVARVAPNPQPDTTYGDFAAGTARRMVFPAWVEHIGVLYSPTSLRETLAWLQQVEGRQQTTAPWLYTPAPWLALLITSAMALLWSLVQFLPNKSADHNIIAGQPAQSRGRWWLVALLPAVLTPVLLQIVPAGSLLPILVGGPLTLFFMLYGLSTFALLAFAGIRPWRGITGSGIARSVAIALLVIGAVALLLGIPVHTFVLNLSPVAARWWIVGVVFVGMLPYFLGDEWMTRMASPPRGAYLITKICFVLALIGAIVLDRSLFFLTLIAPLFVLYFLVFGLLSGWLFRRTGTPYIGALANAFFFAWSVAVVFPLVGG